MNRQPANIFEQILFGTQATNDNVVALSENQDILHRKVDALTAQMAALSAMFATKPTVPGDETIGDEPKTDKECQTTQLS